VTDRFLISRHELPLPFGDRLDERAAQHPHLIAEDSAYLLFILLDEWLHEVEKVTEELDEQIEDMEERAIVDTSRSFLSDIVALKELGFDLYQAIDRHHAVFDATLNPDFPFVAGQMVENNYRDLSRRFDRRVAALSDGRAAINNAINIFTSSTAQRTNRIITLLTIISTVLMPMTAIFAFYGTNFEEPPLFTMRQFILMWAVVLATTVPIVVMLVRRGWLRQM
jgi:magnesium transporter